MDLLFVAIIFFVLGVAFGIFDRKSGLTWYRRWYNLSNQHKLDENVRKGFVTNQPFRHKLTAAIVLASIGFLVLMLISWKAPLENLLYALVGIVPIIGSFYLTGRMLSNIPSGVEKAVDYIEKVESGEANVGKDLVKGAIDVQQKVASTLKEKPEKKEEIPEPAKEVPEPVERTATKPVKEEEEKETHEDRDKPEDWRKGVKDFLDK